MVCNLIIEINVIRWLQFRNPSKIVKYDVENDSHVKNDKGFCLECKYDEGKDFTLSNIIL
jgi:hypothetical protein